MKELKECLACGNKDLKVYCDMGLMPLVNNLKESPEEIEHIFPLLVNECPLCTHKQLSVSVDRGLMFNDYLYQTGTSASHIDFFMDFIFDNCGKIFEYCSGTTIMSSMLINVFPSLIDATGKISYISPSQSLTPSYFFSSTRILELYPFSFRANAISYMCFIAALALPLVSYAKK